MDVYNRARRRFICTCWEKDLAHTVYKVSDILSPTGAGTDTAEWSDPLIGIQFKDFQKYVRLLEGNTLSAKKVTQAVDYLCEWSKGLLNRTFGRTTDAEKARIQALFTESSQKLQAWAEAANIYSGDVQRKVQQIKGRGSNE